MKKLFVLALILIPALALADTGDKQRKQNPVIAPDGTITGVIDSGLSCERLTTDSGQLLWLCGSAEDSSENE